MAYHGGVQINTEGEGSQVGKIVEDVESGDLFENLGEEYSPKEPTAEEPATDDQSSEAASYVQLSPALQALANQVNAAKDRVAANMSPAEPTQQTSATPASTMGSVQPQEETAEDIHQRWLDEAGVEASKLLLPSPALEEGESLDDYNMRTMHENLAIANELSQLPGNLEKTQAEQEQRKAEAEGRARRKSLEEEQAEKLEKAGREDISSRFVKSSPVLQKLPEEKRDGPIYRSDLAQYISREDPIWQLIPRDLWPKQWVSSTGVYPETHDSRLDDFVSQIKALPGSVMKRVYQIPKSIMRKKLTVDEKIEQALKAQAKTALFDDSYEFEERETPLSNLREAELESRVKNSREFIDMAYCPIESQTIETRKIKVGVDPKTGKDKFEEVYVITYTDELTRKAIEQFMREMHYAEGDLWLVHHQLVKYLGYSPDTKGKFLNKDSDKVPDKIVRKALASMLASQKKYGHPYHMGAKIEYGGTRCFPIGVMSKTEADILCRSGGVCEGQDPYDVITKARNYFVEEVQPKIYATKDKAQRYSLENFLRALCSSANISPRKFNVSTIYDRGYAQQVEENDPKLNPNIDPETAKVRQQAIDQADMRRARSRQKLDRERNRTTYYYDEDEVDEVTGEVLHRKGKKVDQANMIEGSNRAIMMSPRVTPIEAFCLFVGNTMKVMGVFGFTPIIVSGFIENFSGSLMEFEANKIFHFFARKAYDTGNMFAPTKLLYAHMNTDEAADAMKAMKSLEMAGGMDALILFRQEYDSLTVDNARKFLQEYVNKKGLIERRLEGKEAEVARKIALKANDALQFLLPGDIGMEKMQARRWLQGLMLNFQQTYAKGDVLEKSYTADEVLEMIQAGGVQQFMAGMVDTVAGRDAFLMMRNQTMSRESPLTHAVDVIFKKHGLVNVFVTAQIDTYFKYGLNLIQLYLPFSNTFSYLVSRGANRVLRGGVRDLSQLDLGILDYQMGGHDAFGQGLAKNLMYDFTRIGNLGIFGCFVAATFLMIGFDEPEDPQRRLVWEEYRIGAKIGLGPKDENGNATGIPLFRAWWLDDLTGFGLPIAYAICTHAINEKSSDPIPYIGHKILVNATADILGGASVFDIVKSVKDAHKNIMEFDDLMHDPNTAPSSGWFSFAYMNLFELPTAKALGKMMPSAFKDWGRDQYEHTAYEVYDRDSDTTGKTKDVTDWVELQRRINAKYNPVYGHILNLLVNNYWEDNGTSTKTGYLYDEMPLATEKDKRRLSFMHELEYDDDEIPEEYKTREQWKKADPVGYETHMEQACERVIQKMAEYDWNVDKALANGFMIPYHLRIELKKYCFRRINEAENKYNELVNQGITGVAKNNAYMAKQQVWDYYNGKIYKEWVNNRDIPWSDAGYAKIKTDYETLYYYTNTGKPATVLEYLTNPGMVEKRMVEKGNRPNSMLIFTLPETENKGYNFETVPEYFDEALTDVEKIFNEVTTPDESGSVPLMPYGKDAGIPTANVIFGGTPRVPTERPILSEEFRSRQRPTTGGRNYVPFNDAMLAHLPNIKKKEQQEDEDEK